MVEIGTHVRNHRFVFCYLGHIRATLPSLNSGTIIFVDERGRDDEKDLVQMRLNKVVEIVQHAVDHLLMQVAFLFLQRLRHQQTNYEVKDGSRTIQSLARSVF